MTTQTSLTTIPVGEDDTGLYCSNLKGDPELIELLVEFISEVPQRLADIRQAAQGQNWQDVRRLAHQLRGAGGSYGYPLLSVVAGQVESLAGDQVSIAELRSALDRLTAISERLRA